MNEIHHIDRICARHAIGTRAHLAECKALLGNLQRQRLNRLIERGGVVGIAGLGGDLAVQCRGVHTRQLRLDADRTKVIQLAFFHDEGDEEARTIPVQLGVGRDHARISITVLQVILAQQFFIEVQTIGIIDVRSLEEVEQT